MYICVKLYNFAVQQRLACVGCHFSHVQLLVTPWTVAHQVPLSMGFSRQEYRNGLPCPSPGDLSNPEIEPESLKSPALAYSVVKKKQNYPLL